MNLFELREQKKMTQQCLADKVGVTRQMISAIENGANPSIETAKKLAAALGVTLGELLGEEGKIA